MSIGLYQASMLSEADSMSFTNLAHSGRRRRQQRQRLQPSCNGKQTLALSLVAAICSVVSAQDCIPLSGSTTCQAFDQSSISLDPAVTQLYPFLSFVSDVQSFDTQLQDYVSTEYVQLQYEQLLGCSDVDLTNTSSLYARYTISVLCNAIIQNSIQFCGSDESEVRPLCADTCAQQAISEQAISSSPELCGTTSDNALEQIRADFTNCALPADSLSTECISGVENEPLDCGYRSNLAGLCSFCASSSPNSTDSCCIGADVEERCVGVELPITTPVAPLFPNGTATPTGEVTAAANGGDDDDDDDGDELSGGAIAGIVVGSVLGSLFVIGLIAYFCLISRKRNRRNASIFNQPSPPRAGPQPVMTYSGDGISPTQGGGRITRMAALEGTSGSSDSRHSFPSQAIPRSYNASSSDAYNDTPRTTSGAFDGRPPKRRGSASSHSMLALGDDSVSPPRDGSEAYSSPEGVASGQSEQLAFFKDYYSQDEIRPGDAVATLWAYQPRANDEFELERGDMLKIVGIWDDGWATGIRITEKAEEWHQRKKEQRDSGMSNGSRGSNPIAVDGDIKAFPLVCVCLPQHWKKTIEGDTTGSTTLPQHQMQQQQEQEER